MVSRGERELAAAPFLPSATPRPVAEHRALAGWAGVERSTYRGFEAGIPPQLAHAHYVVVCSPRRGPGSPAPLASAHAWVAPVGTPLGFDERWAGTEICTLAIAPALIGPLDPTLGGIAALPDELAPLLERLGSTRACGDSGASCTEDARTRAVESVREALARRPPHAHIAAELRRARALLETEVEPGIDLDQLAARVGWSKPHLIRAFRRQYGFTPHAYSLAARIAEARRRLAIPGARPSEVALDVGFFDQSHFHRWFRRAVGVAPAAYARAVGAGPI